MFTGLVTNTSEVVAWSNGRMVVRCPEDWTDIEIGESISINGCCLTTVTSEGDLQFDLSEETVAITALGQLQVGAIVNLERALRLGDRLGGHLVQGHVDCVGTLLDVEELAGSHVLTFDFPKEWQKFVAHKGSITVNGISLTIVEPKGNEFQVAIIPHTWASTNLNSTRIGEKVNLEFDMIVKHLEQLARLTSV